MSLFLWDVECPLFKWLASHSRSGGMPLVSLHSATNTRLSSRVQLILHYYESGLVVVMILAEVSV
jgi:hypothetical protein